MYFELCIGLAMSPNKTTTQDVHSSISSLSADVTWDKRPIIKFLRWFYPFYQINPSMNFLIHLAFQLTFIRISPDSLEEYSTEMSIPFVMPQACWEYAFGVVLDHLKMCVGGGKRLNVVVHASNLL